MKKQYFVLYACCLPVKGYTQSIICDFQRGSFKSIPNSLYEIIINHSKVSTLDEVKQCYPNSDHETIEEYFTFLCKAEYGFWTETPENFPPIKMDYRCSSLINNAIIDSNQDSKHDYNSIVQQLDYLGCKDVQLRFYDEIQPSELKKIISLFEGSRIKSIELILKYSIHFSETFFLELLNDHNRIMSIVVHSGEVNSVRVKDPNGASRLLYTSQKIDSSSHCGNINPLYFSINIETISESMNFNSCLNKKISVDTNGLIKNCPTMNNHFGNIASTSLIDIVSKGSFREVWDLKKDRIGVCKDCEYRYICTDCRAVLTNPDDSLSKPLKCGYDPYLGIWSK